MKLKYTNYLTFSILLALISACAPLSKQVYKSPSPETLEYDVVQIPDFRTNDAIWVPYDSNTVIADMIYEELLRSDKFDLVERSSQSVRHGEKVLLVKGVVTDYDRGCKFCEWFFLGINDKGKSTISVWVELVDKSSGTVLTDFSLHGRAEDPGHGRSRYARVVREISRIINDISM